MKHLFKHGLPIIGIAFILSSCILPPPKMIPEQSGGFAAIFYDGGRVPDDGIYILTLPENVYISSVDGKKYGEGSSKNYFKEGKYNIGFTYSDSITVSGSGAYMYSTSTSAENLQVLVNAISGRTGRFIFKLSNGRAEYRVEDTTFQSTIKNLIDLKVTIDVTGLNKNAIKEKADNGDVDSQFLYGKMRLKGVGTLIHTEDGMKYLKMASNNGSLEPSYTLATEYVTGSWYLKKDLQAAIQYWKKAAKNDHVQSQYAVATFVMLSAGLNQPFNKSELEKGYLSYKELSQKYPYATTVSKHLESFLRLLEREGLINYQDFVAI